MSATLTEIQVHQFDQFLLQQTNPVMVDFWAPWCGPCKAIAPLFASLAEAYAQRMVFAKCNLDNHADVAQRYGIKAIPTLMIFQGDKVLHSITGMVSRSTLEGAIQKVLAGEALPRPFVVN